MRRVLIVTYYWPPAGGPGVQRVLKYVKYLPDLGWEPIVLTVRHGAYPALDPTLEAEVPATTRVSRTFSLEPSALYKAFVGIPKGQPIPGGVLAERDVTVRKRLANWVRMNLFVPDAKVGWVPWAVREGAGAALVREHRPALVMSSSPPPTVHLVAHALSRRHGLPWVADFRDPWTDIHYYDGRQRLEPSRRLDQRLEAATFASATHFTFASSLDAAFYAERYGVRDRVTTITNGFDDADFRGAPPPAVEDGRFTLLHLGSIGNNQFPSGLLDALARMLRDGRVDPSWFRLRLVGALPSVVVERFAAHPASALIEFGDYVPHRDALGIARGAQALLLLVPDTADGRRVLPGKTFEYLRHRRPILALGPRDGEVGRVLRDVGADDILEHADVGGIADRLAALVQAWRRGEEPNVGRPDAIFGYERRQLTARLAHVFERAIDRWPRETAVVDRS